MDGIVMGGGMGISQGARLRIVTPRSKVAMPETNIGLFPDVGGGYFLSRCPGAAGEWLALTGDVIDAATALQLNLADTCFEAEKLQAAWDALAQLPNHRADTLAQWVASYSIAGYADTTMPNHEVEQYFSQGSAADMVKALEASSSAWAQATAATLRTRSPLMMEVTLELVRRARHMTLAQDLRLERDIVRHCFNTRHLNRFMADSETTEGIRALVIDKDNAPKWNPARVEDVTPEMVLPFFDSPWPAAEHPLKDLV
jgi:hypothetical protein